MVRQAVLFTPGDEQRMVEKALTSDADMVILDIEDAVAPGAKDLACETISDVLTDWSAEDIEVEVSVRINPLENEGGRGERDLSMIEPARDKIQNIVLPKVRGTESLKDLTELLMDHGFTANIMPLIETPEAVMNLFEIAQYPRVEGFEFGAEDFTTEIGAVHTEERDEILYARQKVVVAASVGGIDAIDMAWPDFKDPEGLRHNTKQAVNLGFDGKSAIHPVQIEIIKDEFTPDDDQIEWAERVVEKAEEESKRNKVVFQLDGEMIDPPIIARAEDLLKRAQLAE